MLLRQEVVAYIVREQHGVREKRQTKRCKIRVIEEVSQKVCI